MGLKEFYATTVNNFKYNIAPQVIDLFAFPQTLKEKDVVVVKDEETGLYISYDELGYPSFYQPLIITEDAVKFNDGQVLKKGEMAYFKFEPIEFIVGGAKLHKDNKGRLKKTGLYTLTSKKVLCSATTDAYKYFLFDTNEVTLEEFKEGLNALNFTKNATVAFVQNSAHYVKNAFSRIKTPKKVTDFAIALGVYHERKKGQFGLTGGRICWTNGKNQLAPKNLYENEAGAVFAVIADKGSIKQELKTTKEERAKDRQHQKELRDYLKAKQVISNHKSAPETSKDKE